jgi:hypothetical protein
MADESRKEQAPTREALEREARRLARVRHLSLVRDDQPGQATVSPIAFRGPDPDPKAAA